MYGVIDRRALESVADQCDRIMNLLSDARPVRARAATCAFKSLSFTLSALLSKASRQATRVPRLFELTSRFEQISEALLEACQDEGVPIDEIQSQVRAVDRQRRLFEQSPTEAGHMRPDPMLAQVHSGNATGSRQRQRQRPELDILALLRELADQSRTLAVHTRKSPNTLEDRLDEFAVRFDEIVRRIDQQVEGSSWESCNLGKWRLSAEMTESQLDRMIEQAGNQSKKRLQQMQVSLAFTLARVSRYDNDGLPGWVGTTA